MKFVQNAAGAILGPMDSWLVLRGTKTLTVRMERTNENAQRLAEYLDGHPKVQRTIYPGLPTHPHHALARKQMRGFGGLISFDVGSLDAARQTLNRLRLMALAESLGGVETLISHPAIMTHASVPADRRAALGISDGLVRISVGLEDVEDLEADLDQALDSLPLGEARFGRGLQGAMFHEELRPICSSRGASRDTRPSHRRSRTPAARALRRGAGPSVAAGAWHSLAVVVLMTSCRSWPVSIASFQR